MNAASGPEGPQGPTPRREIGMRNAELEDRGDRGTAAGSRQKLDAGIQRTAVGGQRIEVGIQGTEHKSVKAAAVKKVTATGKQMAGTKSRKIDAREQRAENAPLQQRTQAGKRPAESKKQKRKVTI